MSGEEDKVVEAVELYAQLLDYSETGCVDQSFLNGYRRCLMIFDASFRPGESPPEANA